MVLFYVVEGCFLVVYFVVMSCLIDVSSLLNVVDDCLMLFFSCEICCFSIVIGCKVIMLL